MAKLKDYWISFRIHDDYEYNDRYEGLVAAIQEQCGTTWSETTSFILLDSYLNITALAKELTAGLNTSTDTLIIHRTDVKMSRYFGVIDDLDTLEAFFPDIKKLW